MLVGAKVCELTDGFLWFVCGLYVGMSMSPQVHIIHIILLRMLCSGFPYRLGERGLHEI